LLDCCLLLAYTLRFAVRVRDVGAATRDAFCLFVAFLGLLFLGLESMFSTVLWYMSGDS
jgi:hypothetical protein